MISYPILPGTFCSYMAGHHMDSWPGSRQADDLQARNELSTQIESTVALPHLLAGFSTQFLDLHVAFFYLAFLLNAYQFLCMIDFRQ